MNFFEVQSLITNAVKRDRKNHRAIDHQSAIAFVTRLLARRLRQELSEDLRSRLLTLSLPMLEDLGEALLDFTSMADLEAWLKERSTEG
ncbi:DUF4351 domain-containing protein [Leptolyngbya sp. AN03gr2]|uniref:DUF4351 domain-containing protein n=1 Tax=unclassified Leptolyngbya TaxID=2650499 RepID=UPI003D316A7B